MAGNNNDMLSIIDKLSQGANPKELALNIAQGQLGISPEQFSQMAQNMGFRL